jgi:queuine tRNA-ribosyltransferase catalytic subunit
MPVGTKATLKSVLPQEIDHMNCPMILANTYHLALQPGTPLIDSIFGGLPQFMGGEEEVTVNTTNEANHPESTTQSSSSSSSKKRRLFNLLTDSGGFQMVSLAALSNVTEEGVVFESPYEKGKVTKLRPEDSIQCQNEIGADVIMQLDDVISSVQSNDERFRLATLRTLRWYDRCVKAHSKPHSQNLYPILQGHLDISPGGLREICLAGFKHRDVMSETERTIPGFAVGGLAGGEAKEDFWKVVDHACRHLPDNRPRYLMGVGYPLDLVVCTALGIDQYDCVCTYSIG